MPGLLSFSSRLIVLVEAAHDDDDEDEEEVEVEVGSSEIGSSGKVSLS